MFVKPIFQGKGVGIALATEIISKATELGFSKMRLDSGEKQFEAHQLYRKVGFVEIPAYYDVPEDLRNWLTFMELCLA
jgi:GNAT superfamily N-acetyltransferase